MIYIVLGMHKSGTTLISKTLHESGINMGNFDPKISYYDGNKYERLETSMLIGKMLNSLEKSSLDTVPPFEKEKIIKYLNDFNILVGELNKKHELWGFKDPRAIFVYEFIKNNIGDHKIIAIYRDFDEVIKHYSQYNPLYILKAAKAWKEYNFKLLQILKKIEKEKYILLNYDNILKNNVYIKYLEHFTGLEKIIDCRNKNTKKVTNNIIKIISKYVGKILFKLNYLNVKSIYHELKLLTIN